MMNERIKELYDQCFVVLEHDTPNTGFDFEKFAKLIIQECVSICKDRERSNLYGVREVEVAIKEHFGVNNENER